MPRWKQLPDGRWVLAPETNTYYNQLSRTGNNLSPTIDYTSPTIDYTDPDAIAAQAARLRKATLGGSALEAIRAIPGGAMDLGTSAAESILGVLTPFGDLPIEKRIREISAARARKRNPVYADAFLPNVGTGLGQVAGLTALSKIPGKTGKLLGMGSAVSLGISDQTRRIAEYEERTGENIPWYKETMAHVIGGALGFTEILLPQKLAKIGSVKSANRLLTNIIPTKPGSWAERTRSALSSTALEGMQEGMAQGLQSVTARGLYDPNALDNLGRAMMEDAKVGGVVGGIADVATHMLFGSGASKQSYHLSQALQEASKELRKADAASFRTEDGRKMLEALNNGYILDEIQDITNKYGVDEEVAEEINAMLRGTGGGPSLGADGIMTNGSLSIEDMEQYRADIIGQTKAIVNILQGGFSGSDSEELKKRNKGAVKKIKELQNGRVSSINKYLRAAGKGWNNQGGISDNSEYKAYRGARSHLHGTLDELKLAIVANETSEKKGEPEDQSMITKILEAFRGGNYSRRGLFRFAEILGVHQGPGSEVVLKGVPDKKTGLRPDSSLASSDAASYTMPDVGDVIFGGPDGLESTLVDDTKFEDVKNNEKIKETTKKLKQLQILYADVDKQYPPPQSDPEIMDTVRTRKANLADLIGIETQKHHRALTESLIARLKMMQRMLGGEDGSLRRRGAIARLGFVGNLESQNRQLDTWLDDMIEITTSAHNRSILQDTEYQKELNEGLGELKNYSTDELTKAKLDLVPSLTAEHKRPEKIISATNLERIARLLNSNPLKAKQAIDERMTMKATADIAAWQVDRIGNDRNQAGTPTLNPTVKHVENFIDVELKVRQDAELKVAKILKDIAMEDSGTKHKWPKISQDKNLNDTIAALVHSWGYDAAYVSGMVDAAIAKYSASEEGKALLASSDAASLKEEIRFSITAKDIEQLLKSKNIFLRGTFDGDSGEAVRGNIGAKLEKSLGVGVESSPFKKLLADMTGALSWENAGPAQRLLMYSRLLNLPAHRIIPKDENKYSSEPLYLPDFYQTKESQSHLNEITKIVMRLEAKDEGAKGQEGSIKSIYEQVENKLQNSFDPVMFDEALATLIETGVIAHGLPGTEETSDAIKDNMPLDSGGVAPTELGQLGSATNPIQLSISSDDLGAVKAGVSRSVQVDVTDRMDDSFHRAYEYTDEKGSSVKIVTTDISSTLDTPKGMRKSKLQNIEISRRLEDAQKNKTVQKLISAKVITKFIDPPTGVGLDGGDFVISNKDAKFKDGDTVNIKLKGKSVYVVIDDIYNEKPSRIGDPFNTGVNYTLLSEHSEYKEGTLNREILTAIQNTDGSKKIKKSAGISIALSNPINEFIGDDHPLNLYISDTSKGGFVLEEETASIIYDLKVTDEGNITTLQHIQGIDSMGQVETSQKSLSFAMEPDSFNFNTKNESGPVGYNQLIEMLEVAREEAIKKENLQRYPGETPQRPEFPVFHIDENTPSEVRVALRRLGYRVLIDSKTGKSNKATATVYVADHDAVNFALDTGKPADEDSLDLRIKNEEHWAPFRLLENDLDYLEWFEMSEKLVETRRELARTGLITLDMDGLMPGDERILAPWFESVVDGSEPRDNKLRGTTPGMRQIQAVVDVFWKAEKAELEKAPGDVSANDAAIRQQTLREARRSTPGDRIMAGILSSLGLTGVPWEAVIPSTEEDLTPEQLEKEVKDYQELILSTLTPESFNLGDYAIVDGKIVPAEDGDLTNEEVVRNLVTAGSYRLYRKYKKLSKVMFSEVITPVFFFEKAPLGIFANAYNTAYSTRIDGPLKGRGSAVIMHMDRMKNIFESAAKDPSRMKLTDPMDPKPQELIPIPNYKGIWLRRVHPTHRHTAFRSFDDYVAFLVAHEKGHSINAAEDLGQKAQKSGGALVEDVTNTIALNELTRVQYSLLSPLLQQRRQEQIDASGNKFDNDSVRIESDFRGNERVDPSDETLDAMKGDYTDNPYMETETRSREDIQKDIYESESNQQLVDTMLLQDELQEALQELTDNYNIEHPGNTLTVKEYGKKYAAHITSEFGLRELADAGVLETIGARLKKVGKYQTDLVLALKTSAGSEIITALLANGAIPSSLRQRSNNLRKEFLKTTQNRFEKMKKMALATLSKMRIPGNMAVEFVDNMDGLFTGIAEVHIRGEMLPETQLAAYDSASNRIIINLAAIDPDNMVSTQALIQEAAMHEGVHALIIRDHLYDAELNAFIKYGKNNVVPEQVDQKAHEMGLTWFEKEVYDQKDTNLNEVDIEREMIVELVVAITQNKVPDTTINGRIRKTKGFLQGMFEGIIDSAKDSEITDMMQAFNNIESGRTGQRGAGYQGETEFTDEDEIRSQGILRYADPDEVDQLVKAIALRDAAKSDEMFAAEDIEVKKIASKISERRTELQESSGKVDEFKAISNIREAIKDVQAENPYAIPLLNGENWTMSTDPEARRVALDEFLKNRRMKDGVEHYTMPRTYQNMFNRQHDISQRTKSIVDRAVEEGLVTGVDGDNIRKSLGSGVLSGNDFGGNDVAETDINIKTTASNMRYQFLDRRQWLVEQTDRILAAQNRAMVDAETSAIVMFRNADNAVNWLGGMMKRGPLSYLGFATGSGQFDIAPVYDNILAEKYDSDGRVKGLLDIFSSISKPIDEQTATLYGMAKRVLWTKKRLEETRNLLRPLPYTGSLKIEYEDSELVDRLKMFEKAYNDINPKVEGEQRKWAETKVKGREGLVIESAEEIIASVESSEPHIIEFWDNYQAFNRANIRMAFDTGMITLDQRDEWLAMPYTPFYRETNPMESFPVGSGQQMAKRGRLSIERALSDSLKPVNADLMNNIMENTQALVRDAMINVAAARTARDAIDLNEAKLVAVSDMAGDIDNNVIRVMERGVAKHYQLDDTQLAMSVMMLGFNPKKRIQDLFGGMEVGEYVAKGFTGASSLLREAVTRTPPFQIKNILRDSWQASTIVGGGPLLVLDSIKNALDPNVQKRAEEKGLSIGIDFVAEPGEYGNLMRKQLKNANLDWSDPLAGFSAIWTFLGNIAKQSEVATRVAVYDRVLAQTGDHALAQYTAVEIMNYGRRGANPALSTYMATVPFMNGRMQGLDVIWRGIQSKLGSSDIPGIAGYGMTKEEFQNIPVWEQNRQKILGRGLVLSAATMMWYWMMYDDDEYQDLRDEVKADNWLFPVSDHAWLKIPIPFEVGVIFKVIPEQIMRAMLEKDYDMADASGEVKRQISTSLSLSGPQLVSPLAGAWRNYDKYRKDYIVDPFMDDSISPNEQRNRFTSNTARTLADTVNMIPLLNNVDFLTSPMKMEYMLRQYFGTMGGYVITAADRIARAGVVPTIPIDPLMNWSEAENIVGTGVDFDWESMIGGPGVANVPILGDLLIDPRTRAGKQQEFYELIQELDTVVGTLNSINEKDRAEGIDYENKHRELLMKKGQIRLMETQMKEWRERRDREFDLPRASISDDDRRDDYQSLIDYRNYILQDMDRLLEGEKRARSLIRWGGK